MDISLTWDCEKITRYALAGCRTLTFEVETSSLRGATLRGRTGRTHGTHGIHGVRGDYPRVEGLELEVRRNSGSLPAELASQGRGQLGRMVGFSGVGASATTLSHVARRMRFDEAWRARCAERLLEDVVRL